MVKKGGQRGGRRTILERLCHAWLDEYPEKIYVTVSKHFDPEAFGWSHIMPRTGSITAERTRAVERARIAENTRATESDQAAERTRATEGTDDRRYLTLASPEFWLMMAVLVANGIAAWGVVSFLAMPTTFFYRLMRSLPIARPEAWLLVCQSAAWLVAALAATHWWDRPPTYSLPRVVLIAAVALTVVVLGFMGAVSYCYAWNALGVPEAWEGFLWS